MDDRAVPFAAMPDRAEGWPGLLPAVVPGCHFRIYILATPDNFDKLLGIMPGPVANPLSPVGLVLSRINAIVLLLALIYAPFAYGCTLPATLPPLYALLSAAIFLHAGRCVCEQRWPQLPFVLVLAVGCILLQGWWQARLPHFVLADDGEEVNVQRWSIDAMWTTTFLLGGFCVFCDSVRARSWLQILALGAVVAGVSVSATGILLKLAGPGVLSHIWTPREMNWNNFAFYKYHGTAGAYLNLVWPLTLAFTRRSYDKPASLLIQMVWTLATIISGLAFFFNASKASLVIALIILPLPFWSFLKRMRRDRLIGLVAGVLLVSAAASAFASWFIREAAFQRLTESANVSISAEGRLEAYRQYLAFLPHAGAWGIGPGLFQAAFPYQNSPLGNDEPGLREFAYEDYLQSVIEWGWCGTVVWSLLVFGSLYQGWSIYCRRRTLTNHTDRHLLLGFILGVCGGLAHATFDFPLQVASIRLYFFLLLAVCWSAEAIFIPPRPPASSTRGNSPQ